MAIKEVSACCG